MKNKNNDLQFKKITELPKSTGRVSYTMIDKLLFDRLFYDQ